MIIVIDCGCASSHGLLLARACGFLGFVSAGAAHMRRTNCFVHIYYFTLLSCTVHTPVNGNRHQNGLVEVCVSENIVVGDSMTAGKEYDTDNNTALMDDGRYSIATSAATAAVRSQDSCCIYRLY